MSVDPVTGQMGPERSLAAASKPPMVELRGVDKTFTSRAGTTTALEGIDLRVGAGEFVSLIGPSGCGKSTLLRVVGDLLPATAGSVTVNGKPARQARLERDYGMVFQAPVLLDWRTVEANVRLPGTGSARCSSWST
jgi:NitT/TauT family transport system ATP-binding protein